MQVSDLEAVVALEQDANVYPWNFQQIQDSFLNASSSSENSALNSKYECWVCCLSDGGNTEKVAGYGIVASVLDESDLLNLCVAPKYQGQGYGRKLLKYLIKHAQQDQQRLIFLEVRHSNKKAIHLYESLLFEKISVRKLYYPGVDGREDALIYSLSLV